jgi:hypothetical protein
VRNQTFGELPIRTRLLRRPNRGCIKGRRMAQKS